MLSNHIKIVWRKIIRQKGFTALNLLGLAVGLAATFLMVGYVYHKYSFDRFHEQADKIYQTSAVYYHGDQEFNSNNFSAFLGPLMAEKIPGIESFVRFRTIKNVILSTEDGRQKHTESSFHFVDSNFLEMFTFELLDGREETALQQPFSILLTPEMALKYFGQADPLGKTLHYLPPTGGYLEAPVTEPYAFTVTGIIAPAPANSNIQYDFIAAFSSLKTIIPRAFDDQLPQLGGFQTYFLLRTPQYVEDIRANIQLAINEGQKMDREIEISLKTLPETYFDEEVKKKLGLFVGIALLVLLLAIVNYASLTTARATQRAREVGVRKTLGARRGQLIVQFFAESSVMVLLGFGLAFLLAKIALPTVNQIADTQIGFQVFYSPIMIVAVIAILGLSIFLAGSYPALTLSRFLPVLALRMGQGTQASGERTRRALMVFQFVISATLIVCSLVMQTQMNYLGKRDLGFDKEQLLVVPFEAEQPGTLGALKSRYLQEPGIVSGGISTAVPFKPEGTSIFFEETPKGDPISLFFLSIDRDFLSTMGVSWAAGDLAGNTAFGHGDRIILNQTAFDQLQLETGLGERILKRNDNDGYEISGVIEDYTFFDYRNEVGPQVLFEMSEADSRELTRPAYLTLRLEPGIDIQEKITRLKNIYESLQPVKPFDFFFVDNAYDNLFRSETRTASLFKLFTTLAIFIACLGLLGLSAYMAERRAKEIGIRKVFGASVAQIIGLLSRDFLYLVGIALLIALPLAWYFMSQWLEGFTFRIKLNWWLFGLAAVLALSIAFLTVSVQSAKAALVNPVKSLRNE